MPTPRNAVEEKLVDYLIDIHAMEENVSRMLDSMIENTDNKEIKDMLVHHKTETEGQLERIEVCLDSYDTEPSRVKEGAAKIGAALTGLVNSVRDEKAGKTGRDAFATEALEIASYEILERWAKRAGNEQVERVARENRREEEAMAGKIASNWDRFVDETVREVTLSAN